MYAIKVLRKDVLLDAEQIDATFLEKNIMFNASSPFLANMNYIFANDLRLFFVMPFINGGELYKVYCQYKRFPEDLVKFYAA